MVPANSNRSAHKIGCDDGRARHSPSKNCTSTSSELTKTQSAKISETPSVSSSSSTSIPSTQSAISTSISTCVRTRGKRKPHTLSNSLVSVALKEEGAAFPLEKAIHTERVSKRARQPGQMNLASTAVKQEVSLCSNSEELHFRSRGKRATCSRRQEVRCPSILELFVSRT